MASLFLPAPQRSSNRNNSNNASIPPHSSESATNNAIVPSKSTTTITSNNTKGQKLLINRGRQKQRAVLSYIERCTAAVEASNNRSKNYPSEPSTSTSKSKTGGLFVPRCTADFGDGGAFPEIHVAQYPRNMGNPHLARRMQRASKDKNEHLGDKGKSMKPSPGSSVATTRAIVPLSTSADGSKDYTTILSATSASTNTKLYAKHHHLKPYTPDADTIATPTETDITTTTNRTAEALQSLLASQTKLANPSGSAFANASTSRDQHSKTQFVSYKPNPNAPGYNASSAPQRIVRIVPKQLDPMMPPKHKHLKAPRGPEEDAPPPVLHAPSVKLTKEERESWDVPACISNWKNTRGYTIPLDKRLAADGRGCREDSGTVNSNFANLSESLYLAEREAREEVRVRADVRRRQVEGERERRERELRELAMRARVERGGGGMGMEDRRQGAFALGVRGGVELSSSLIARENALGTSHTKGFLPHIVPDSASDSSSDEDEGHDTERKLPQQHQNSENNNNLAVEQREKIRQERRKERVRELRMESHKQPRGEEEEADGGDGVVIKKARLDGDRDVSEKIALGVHTGSGVGGVLGGGVDSRLYNQNAGLDSGFGADDEYSTYTKPMFDKISSSSIYRPSRGEGAMDGDEQYEKLAGNGGVGVITSKFQPDKGFKGAEGGGGDCVVGSGAARDAPVQFEKDGEVSK